MRTQKDKGMALAISAYLLITVYGIVFFKLGRVVLPHELHVGSNVVDNWVLLAVLILINPLL